MVPAVRGLATVVVAALVLSGIGDTHAAAPSAEKIEAARKAAMKDDLQKQLPRYEDLEDPNAEPGKPRPPRRVDPRRRSGGDVSGPNREFRDTREVRRSEEPSGLVGMLMWGGLIVLAILFAVWISSELLRDDKDAEVPASESLARVEAAVDAIIDRPLGDADELAARGDYAEAIHTLLLRTLQELVRSAAVRVAPAMTSREILARVPLLADARDALAGLITAVEITHFGDEPANAADYQRCRDQFNLFATALRGRGVISSPVRPSGVSVAGRA